MTTNYTGVCNNKKWNGNCVRFRNMSEYIVICNIIYESMSMDVEMLSKRKLLHSLRELFKIQNSEEVLYIFKHRSSHHPVGHDKMSKIAAWR